MTFSANTRTAAALLLAFAGFGALTSTSALAQSARTACVRECDGDNRCVRACHEISFSQSRPSIVLNRPPRKEDEPEVAKAIKDWRAELFNKSDGAGGGGGGSGR